MFCHNGCLQGLEPVLTHRGMSLGLVYHPGADSIDEQILNFNKSYSNSVLLLENIEMYKIHFNKNHGRLEHNTSD